MGRSCASVQNFFRKIDQYPAQRANLAALDSLAKMANIRSASLRAAFPTKIPVVVHVLHTGGVDNIPDEQVVSQIDVLNEDFNGKNSDAGNVPAPFKDSIGNPGIDKADFELFSLAVSAQNGCGMCIDSHERVLTQHGIKAETIQSAARVAAIMTAVATVHATL